MKPLLLIVLAILLPPVAVALVEGIGKHFLLNLLLVIVTLDIGAIIHALWLVSTRHEHHERPSGAGSAAAHA